MTYAKKRFGQNFLHDQNIVRKIVRVINIQLDDHLVEIGPGKAALTRLLLIAKQVDIIEIDNDLIADLQQLVNQHPQLILHHTDALTFDYASLVKDNKLLRVVGNLPYNISTPLIFHLLSFKEQIQDMHFMLQKEVVERICAPPGSKTYGRLSIMTQYYCTVEHVFNVPPTAFTPVPKVDSAIIRLIPHRKLPFVANDEQRLQQIVTQAFSQRRKTLHNCLKEFITPAQWQQLGINPQLRPEQLSVAEYVKIANI